jgi:hypothetical protein
MVGWGPIAAGCLLASSSGLAALTAGGTTGPVEVTGTYGSGSGAWVGRGGSKTTWPIV